MAKTLVAMNLRRKLQSYIKMKMPEIPEITEDTERNFVSVLREYYRENFDGGESDELFLLWIELLITYE